MAVHPSQRDNPPLAGIRVLDFGRFVAAPYCGMLLADMGAEVLRIERPGGDEDRRVGLKAPNGENLIYPSLARGKKSITLDLASPAGAGPLEQLITHADVVLHNFSPRAAAKMRLGYADVRQVKPDIIYTAISMFGSSGPYALRPGFDPIAQAASGAMSLTGTERAPVRSGVPWVDYSTGMLAALGTVAALYHRRATGRGQAVDCALLQTAINCVTPMVAEALVTGRERPRLQNRAAYLGPTDLYECRDGRVYVATATAAAWRSLMCLIGRGDLADSASLSTDEQRFEQREQVDPLVKRWMRRRRVANVVAALVREKIPCGVYRTTAEIPNDPQVLELSMLAYADLEHPGMSRVPVARFPIRFSTLGVPSVTRPPRPGEHNEHVYCGLLGYDAAWLAHSASQSLI